MTVSERENTPILPLDDPRLAFITNKWSRTATQPILITVLITALLSAMLVLTELLTEERGWLIFGVFIFFAALEGCYTTLWLQQPARRLLNHTAYRAAELLLLIILLRLFTWGVTDSWPPWADIPDLLRFPLLLFANAKFIWGGLLTLAGWNLAAYLGKTFTGLSIDQAEVYYYAKLGHQRNASDKPVRTNRGEMVASFFRLWIGGAVVLALVTSMSSFDLANFEPDSPITIARLGLRPELLTYLLLYFLAGFALLSQARLAAMNARWLINGVTRAGEVERTWYRFTLWLLGGIAFIAAFLPLGSTFAISNILQSIIFFVTTAVGAILSFFAVLLALILSLFSGPGAEAGEPLAQPTLAPLPTPSPTPIPSSLPPPAVDTGLLLSSMFWAVAIVVSVLAINFFLRDRGVVMNTAVVQSYWQRIRQWLRSVWQGATVQVRDWQQAVRSRLQVAPEEEASAKPPWRFIRINALSPREQIRYFYLSTVKRASAKGVARLPDETPLEFAEDLKESWPDAEQDVDALTEAFLEARYGRRPIEKEDVNPVKKRWRQVKSSLRRR